MSNIFWYFQKVEPWHEERKEIFWKALVESDVSPLTEEERKEIDKGRVEFEKGETIKWDSLK